MSTTQVVTKLLLSVPLVVLLVFVWRSPLDFAHLGEVSISDWLRRTAVLPGPREPNAIYQNGAVVGRVEGVEIDEGERLVRFRAIYATAPLEMGRALAFRSYTLRTIAIEGLASADVARADESRIYQDVTCRVPRRQRRARGLTAAARVPWPRRVLLVVGVALVTACAPRTPRVPYGALAPGLEDFLDAHPLGGADNIRADEIGRTAGASYHVVQVRGAERPHRHATHDVTVLVLRGHGMLTLGVERLGLGTGDAAVIPRDVPHWFANGGKDPAVALAVFTPPLDAPDSVPVTAVDSSEDRR